MFKQGGNKYDSQEYQDFPAEIIDDFIYDGLLDYIKLATTTQPKNGYMVGFESNQQRLDMIQPYIKHVILNPIYNKIRGKQKVTVFKLPADYYTQTQDVFAFDDCGNTIKIDIVQYQNLESHLNVKDQQLWSIAYATLKNNELHVFYPELLASIELNYVMLPMRPFFGNYNTLESITTGQTTINLPRVNTLVPEGYCHILMDIVIANVFGNLRDYNLAQYKQQQLNL
jgi:hypothetical protein